MATDQSELLVRKAAIRFNNASLVTILAGQVPHQEKFMVHDWIIQRSEFFQRALDGQRAEVDKRVIELPIDDPVTVQNYFEFIYTDELSFLSEKCTGERCTHFRTIAELYMFADKLQDLKCRKAFIQKLCYHILERKRDGKSFIPECFLVGKIYKDTVEGDPIRVLMVDVWKTCRMTTERVQNLPKDFLKDLITSCQDSITTTYPYQDNFFHKGAKYYMDKVGGSD